MSALPVNSTLNSRRYKILKHIKPGGFGLTYLCVDRKTRYKVVIKECFVDDLCRRVGKKIATKTSSDALVFAAIRSNFHFESTLLREINHESIVPVWDTFMENNTFYYVMPFVAGTDLLEIIKEYPDGVPLEIIKAIAVQCGSAVAHVHTFDPPFLHRDIKPANILISRDRDSIKVTLIDFGAAREFSPDKTELMTRMYTPGYAPPEYYESIERRGPESDIYSFSATLYHAITGKIPQECRSRIANPLMKSPSEIRSDIRNCESMAIMTGLNLQFEKRPKNIYEFLKIYLDSEPELSKNSNSLHEPKSKFNIHIVKYSRIKIASFFLIILAPLLILKLLEYNNNFTISNIRYRLIGLPVFKAEPGDSHSFATATTFEANGVNRSGLVVGRNVLSKDGPKAFAYRAKQLVPLRGAAFTWATSVSDSGYISGWVNTDDMVRTHFYFGNAAVWNPSGKLLKMPLFQDYKYSYGKYVNISGRLVGFLNDLTYYEESSKLRAFVWDSGTGISGQRRISKPEILPAFDGASASANGINSKNDVVGGASDGVGKWKACIWKWDGSSYHINYLEKLEREFSKAMSINNRGDIAGVLFGENSNHAFVCFEQSKELIMTGELPGYNNSLALSINDNQVVVGECSDSIGNNQNKAFIWTKKDGIKAVDELVDDPNQLVLSAKSISNNNIIAGIGRDNAVVLYPK